MYNVQHHTEQCNGRQLTTLHYLLLLNYTVIYPISQAVDVNTRDSLETLRTNIGPYSLKLLENITGVHSLRHSVLPMVLISTTTDEFLVNQRIL